MKKLLFGYLAAFYFLEVLTSTPEPEFGAVIPSLKIIAGRDAVLKCVVNYLGEYKVAWINVDKQKLLSIHTHVISRNPRISVSNPNPTTWYLHLKDVIPEDSGYYMCQINTQPMKSQVGYLNVVVPPEFLTNMTNRNVTVTENSNVTISCKASGNPEPIIKWKREDGQPFVVNGKQVRQYENDELAIVGVTRLHMAAYLCLASNGIPPAISRRIYLDVTFSPLIWIPNQIVGAHEGKNVSLECHTEAHPASHNEWLRDGDQPIPKNERYKTYVSRNSYKAHMKLTITQLSLEDYGSYRCVAKNNIGDTEGSITLYKLKIPTPETRIIFTQAISTQPPTVRTTIVVTPDQRAVTAEVERRDKSNAPGFQQKYGDGRILPNNSKSDASKCHPWFWTVIVYSLRTSFSIYGR